MSPALAEIPQFLVDKGIGAIPVLDGEFERMRTVARNVPTV
jgi:hypothetical protein